MEKIKKPFDCSSENERATPGQGGEKHGPRYTEQEPNPCSKEDGDEAGAQLDDGGAAQRQQQQRGKWLRRPAQLTGNLPTFGTYDARIQTQTQQPSKIITSCMGARFLSSSTVKSCNFVILL